MWVTVTVLIMDLYAYLLVGAPTDGVYSYVFRVPLGALLVIQGFTAVGVWRHGQPCYDSFAFKVQPVLTTPLVFAL